MAYGNTGSVSSAYLDILAGTVDEWVNFGTNAFDLFSSHRPLMAILLDNSMQPGGDYQFQQLEMNGGVDWRIPIIGRKTQGGNAPAGVTRANLPVALTPAIPNNLVDIKWIRSNYRGALYDDIVRQTQNQGKQAMVDMGQAMVKQIEATFYDEVGTDLWDNVVGTEDKVQSINACLANSTTVGGIDQSDTANNLFWNAQQDTNAETWSLPTWSRLFDKCTIDTPSPTGVGKGAPDISFLYGDQYSMCREALIQAQRVPYEGNMVRGGARYMEANGVRFFRTTEIVANTYVILNSRTWAFRYVTKSPMAITPGFTPVSNMPGMFERQYFWTISLGGYSMKHNGLATNKTT